MVNSVDYLLKPIKSEELERAIQEFSNWTKTEIAKYLSRLVHLVSEQRYKNRLYGLKTAC